MEPKKLDEIRAWWVEIDKLEIQGKAVDLISFADAAHEYIPILLAELERLRGAREMANAVQDPAHAGPKTGSKSEGIPATPCLSAPASPSGFPARSGGLRVPALTAEQRAP